MSLLTKISLNDSRSLHKSTSEKVQFAKPSSLIIDKQLINYAEMNSLVSVSEFKHQI